MFPTSQVGNFCLHPERVLCDELEMSDPDEFRGKKLYAVLIALKPADLSEAEWAVRAGVNRGFFTNLKNQPISPRSDTLRKVLAAIGRTEADLYDTSRKPDLPMTRSVDAGETATLGRLDLSLPMGPGASVDDYVEDEPVIFDLGYLRAFTRTPAHRLKLARGVGDSMSPTILPNDEVLIDTTQNQLLHSDRVYAASINGGAAIKRLRPIEGGKRILVISDNKTIEAYAVDADEVRIWGRVIRFSRDL
jgi:phage repressor protein C with HTH and peptisase S24 domain